MRSRAVGIDKQKNGLQKNGFVNLSNFPFFVFELFQTVYRLKNRLGAASVLRGRRVGPSRAGPTQRTLLLRHYTGKWLKR